MRIVQVAGTSAPVTTFPASREIETDAFAATVLPLDPNGDYRFWDYVLPGDPTDGRKTFPVSAPSVADANGATLQVRLQRAHEQRRPAAGGDGDDLLDQPVRHRRRRFSRRGADARAGCWGTRGLVVLWILGAQRCRRTRP